MSYNQPPPPPASQNQYQPPQRTQYTPQQPLQQHSAQYPSQTPPPSYTARNAPRTLAPQSPFYDINARVRPRDIYSRLADVGQRVAVLSLLGLTVWGAYKFGTGYYAIHERRVQWERDNPEMAAEVAEQMRVEKEAKKARRG